jgi:hypothetical protein
VNAGSNELQWENVMTIFHKGSKKVMMRRFARAAVVAAFLCTTGAAETMDMPANCQQQMQQCSLKVWGHNSFAKAGETQSVTFSNGAVLTCTSTGANKPRNCKFDPPPDEALRQKCADLKADLVGLGNTQRDISNMVGNERNYLDKAMQMTPAELGKEIDELQDIIRQGYSGFSLGDEISRQDDSIERRELKFLQDVSNSKTLGPELGGATAQKLQARANQMVSSDQTWANDLQKWYDQQINDTNDRIGKLNCINVPVPLKQ